MTFLEKLKKRISVTSRIESATGPFVGNHHCLILAPHPRTGLKLKRSSRVLEEILALFPKARWERARRERCIDRDLWARVEFRGPGDRRARVQPFYLEAVRTFYPDAKVYCSAWNHPIKFVMPGRELVAVLMPTIPPGKTGAEARAL